MDSSSSDSESLQNAQAEHKIDLDFSLTENYENANMHASLDLTFKSKLNVHDPPFYPSWVALGQQEHEER